MCRRAEGEQGIALLIVVSVLTVVGIMGVAFAFSMYLETQATQQFVATHQARYLAEAGVAHARALLDEDKTASRVDHLEEFWASEGAGSDTDVDGDGARESKWWLSTGTGGQLVGRYAIAVADESGKANLNAAQADPDPLGVGAINATKVLQAAGISDAHDIAVMIEEYRHGPDERPGKAGIDDDGDGAIDELDEYQPFALQGDDRRIESLEELRTIAGLAPQDIKPLSRVATVYSWDANVTVGGASRVNVNTATAAELLPILMDAGVDDPWQVAVNMADAVDADPEMSQVTRTSVRFLMSDQGAQGSWTWSDQPHGHYRSTSSGATLSWSITVASNTYRVLVKGLPGVRVGDVAVGGQSQSSMDSGESLGMLQLEGPITIQVTNHEPSGTLCAFRGLELVPESASGGTAVRGIEAVRLNELMIEPSMTFDVSAAEFDPQGSGWQCPGGGAPCLNSAGGQGRWTWTSLFVPAGRYYVRVHAAAAGQTVGNVSIDGDSRLLVHQQRHPATLLVGSDGKISVAIGKTAAEGTYYLLGLTISLQPDAEYVELINLSDAAIDVGGWQLSGELGGGRVAKLPSGSVIQPHALLVAAVDVNDNQTGLGGNGIEAKSSWSMADGVNAVQLEFPGGAPTPDDDWLKATPPSGTSTLRLQTTHGAVVDEIEYPAQGAGNFQSLEKGDPSIVIDGNGDGVDDGWYPSLQLYTPGLKNDNEGLKEIVGLTQIVHDPATEVTVLNRPLGGVGELAGLASGIPWRPFSTAELARIVDRVTVDGYRLEAEGHWTGSEGSEAWTEKTEGYYLHTDPAQAAAAGHWRWMGLPNGTYRISLYGCSGCQGEQMAVRWQRVDESFTEWSPLLATDIQGRIVIGTMTVGPAPAGASDIGTASQTVTLEVTCASADGICHVDYLRLDPQLVRVGPVNVNTASRDVLLALPGMTEALASRLMTGRPYGDQRSKGLGIGDLLLGDVLGSDEATRLAMFREIAHLLTTRSDLFRIVGLGQAMHGSRTEATQRITAVIQR